MLRQALAILLAVALPAGLRAQSPGTEFSAFLEERVALIPEDRAIPDEALPNLTVRADINKGSLLLVFDCDARNLNPPEGEAAPYTLELLLSSPDGKRKFAFLVTGSRSADQMDLVVTPAPGREKEALPEQVTARQTTREDGIRRVSVSIPLAELEKFGITEHARWQAIWRQLTNYSHDQKPVYAPTGGLVLALPTKEADLFLRSPLPADVVAMLTMLSSATDARCEARCMRRLLWVGARDESLRGALVMALEHADPSIRRASARVWIEWLVAETPGLAELKSKAEAILLETEP
ncbi:MAG: hypothetical protein ACKO2G_14670 [Verrucomicrobiales bacterium]